MLLWSKGKKICKGIVRARRFVRALLQIGDLLGCASKRRYLEGFQIHKGSKTLIYCFFISIFIKGLAYKKSLAYKAKDESLVLTRFVRATKCVSFITCLYEGKNLL